MFLNSYFTDPVVNYRDFMAVVHLAHRSDINVRVAICKKVSFPLVLGLLINSSFCAVLQLVRRSGIDPRLAYAMQQTAFMCSVHGREETKKSGVLILRNQIWDYSQDHLRNSSLQGKQARPFVL